MLTPFTENYLGLKNKNVRDIPWFVTTVFSLFTSKLTQAQKAFAFVHCYLLSFVLAQEILLNEWLREGLDFTNRRNMRHSAKVTLFRGKH